MNYLVWSKTKKALKLQLSEIQYTTWIEPLILKEIKDGTVYVITPSGFYYDIVKNRFSEIILKTLNSVSNIKLGMVLVDDEHKQNKEININYNFDKRIAELSDSELSELDQYLTYLEQRL